MKSKTFLSIVLYGGIAQLLSYWKESLVLSLNNLVTCYTHTKPGLKFSNNFIYLIASMRLWGHQIMQNSERLLIPMMTLVKASSSPLSCWYTILTKALLAAGFPTGAPWIKSFRVFTRRLLVLSANTKLMASIRLDFPRTEWPKDAHQSLYKVNAGHYLKT